jgi:hypothetical protein
MYILHEVKLISDGHRAESNDLSEQHASVSSLNYPPTNIFKYIYNGFKYSHKCHTLHGEYLQVFTIPNTDKGNLPLPFQLCRVGLSLGIFIFYILLAITQGYILDRIYLNMF